MQNLSKKSLSEVINVVFLIMITILAVTIIAVMIRNTTKQVEFSPEQLCIFNINPLTIKNACYNQETSDLQVTITRNNLQSINVNQFVFLVDSQESNSWRCGNCDNCKVLESGEKIYYINQATKPEKVSILLDSCILDTKQVRDC